MKPYTIEFQGPEGNIHPPTAVRGSGGRQWKFCLVCEIIALCDFGGDEFPYLA